MATEYHSDLAIHPGEILGEELAVRGLTQKDLATSAQRPPQVISEIVRGKKSITAQTALELEPVLGISARTWMNLQVEYDLVRARESVSARSA